MSIAIVIIISILVLGLKALFLAKLDEKELRELAVISCPICRSNLQTVAAFRSLWRVIRRCARSSAESHQSPKNPRASLVR